MIKLSWLLSFHLLQLFFHEINSMDNAMDAESFPKNWPKAPRTHRPKGKNQIENAELKIVKIEEIEFCDDALPISKVKIETDDKLNSNERKPKKAVDQLKPIKKEENEQNTNLEVKNPNKNIKTEEQNNEKDTTSSSNYSDYSASSADNSADGNTEESDSEIHAKLKKYQRIKKENPKFSDEKIAKKHFGVNPKILYKWKVKFDYQKRQHSHEEIAKIIKLYKKLKEKNMEFTDKKFADKFGITTNTLMTWKNVFGLEKCHTFSSKEQIQKFMGKYHKIKDNYPNITDAKIAEHFGIHRRTLYLWKKKHGHMKKPNPFYTEKDKFNVIKRYKNLIKSGDYANDYEIAKKLNIHRTTLTKWKKEFGLESRKGYSYKEKMKILWKYKQLKKKNKEMSDKKIAEQLKINKKTLKNWKLEKRALKDFEEPSSTSGEDEEAATSQEEEEQQESSQN